MTSNFVCNYCRGTVCEEAHTLPMLNIQGKKSCVKCRLRIEKALENYVCIPKGENRHTDADILHEIIENRNGQRRAIDHGYKNNEWEDWKFYPVFEFRIKPSEPIYEYMIYDKDGNTTWATEEKFTTQTTYPYIAMSTKRELVQS